MPTRKGIIDSNTKQKAMDRACKELEIKGDDQPNRRRIAFLVAGFSRAGVHDVEGLTSHVVTQFKVQI